MRKRLFLMVILTAAIALNSAFAGKTDISKDKTLYVVGYSHLDSQWRWHYKQTINEFLKNTLEDNFALFEKYPEYVFNFTGARRYQLMDEYYPEKFQRLKEYVEEGRWRISGSSVDEGETTVSSSESLIRQVLYGNHYFRNEFGKESVDYMLPDCFGFPASLPSILSHCGIKGFSTQKLTWGSAVGIPFNFGVWEGYDGESIFAALNPSSYVSSVDSRLDIDPEWVSRVNENGKESGVFVDFRYYGVGDVGGAPREKDVKQVVNSLDNPDGKIDINLGSSDQIFRDVPNRKKAKLPKYKGDLLLTEHSAGSITSQGYMKRWNRKNEQLAMAAEKAASTAYWLGGQNYPSDKLRESWTLVLGSQMHDIVPGVAIPKAFEYSWNDEIIAMNGFVETLNSSVGSVSRYLDTRVKGKPVLVYNPLAIEREDVVKAEIKFGQSPVEGIKVLNEKGKEVPSQLLSAEDGSAEILFVANTPSVSYSVYDVRISNDKASKAGSGLKVTKRSLENEYYKVKLNNAGDIASIYDKKNNKQLLAKPSRLEFREESPKAWPGWNMDWDDRQAAPLGYVDGPAEFEIVEDGPARIAVCVTRKARNSIFKQTISLSTGKTGKRVQVKNYVDWQSKGVSLKATFPLTVSNPKATYNWEACNIKRTNNNARKYEVPSHEWFDLTDTSGDYGVTILENCKYGSDKPTDDKVRLTLLYTPDPGGNYTDQGTQDFGRHEFTYAIYGHAGDCHQAGSTWQGRFLNQPVKAFQLEEKHSSPAAGNRKQLSMFDLNSDRVDIRAIKKAEDGDYLIFRMQELMGEDSDEDIVLSAASPIVKAFEVDGQERRIAPAVVSDGKLVFKMSEWEIRAFAVKLKQPGNKLSKPASEIVRLPFNRDVISSNDNTSDGNMQDGLTYPAEQLPDNIISENIRFGTGYAGNQINNAVACSGQEITLPDDSDYNKLYILAAAAEDTSGIFTLGNKEYDIQIQKWNGFVGQYDNRIWNSPYDKVVGLEPGYIKKDNIAWFATHTHSPEKGNLAYDFCYLYKYSLDLNGAKKLVLPDNKKIKVFAVTVAENDNDAVIPATSQYDNFEDMPTDLELR